MPQPMPTVTVVVIALLVLVAMIAGALMLTAYLQGEEELILPAAGVAVFSLLMIHPARAAGRRG